MKQQMTKTSGNIVEFNDWVCNQVGQLCASREEATDLLAYLWKTYLVMPDQEFVDYTKFLHNEYADACMNYSAEQLMMLAKNKYTSHLLSGEWGNPSDE